MSVRLCLLAAVLATTGCSSRDVDCDSLEFKSYVADLEASVGAGYANEYFTILRKPIDSCEAQYRRAMYIDSFFEGYRGPRDTTGAEPSAELQILRAGMRAGQEYRRSHPNSAAKTYTSFGYTAVSIEGLLNLGFETSRFVPIEGYEGEVWWFDPLPELAVLPVPKEGIRVLIVGYVSKTGQHGHLGAYQRRVYVESLSLVDSAQQSVQPDRREDAAPG